MESSSHIRRSFERRDRLLVATDYQHVFAKPRRSRDHLWTVLARNVRSPTARLGLAVSKRVAKQAVQRNRLKRLVRECFRLERELLGPNDIVVMANRAAPTATASELRTSLLKHLRKLCASPGK